MKKRKKIPINKLATYRHVKFLIATEKQALLGYRFVMLHMISDITNALKKKKLAKSDELDSGWSGDVPKVEFDTLGIVSGLVENYMEALRWMLLGAAAGKKAQESAKKLGLSDKVVPGMVQSAYLQSIDAHSEHYEDVLGKTSPEMPKELVKESLDQIMKRVNILIDQTLSQLKTNVTSSVARQIDSHNMANAVQAHEKAHDLLPELGTNAVSEAVSDMTRKLDIALLTKDLKSVAESFETNWDNAVKADLGMASAAGTHQSLLEIYGKDDPNVKVAWVEMEDERVCDFCHEASKKADGSFKIYTMSDFEPSGYNYGKKRSQWKLAIPPVHFRCRCSLVYIPAGFRIRKDGTLEPI
jgi:hypothetical protein